jgi:hypothetical protein
MKRVLRWGLFLVTAVLLAALGALFWVDSLVKAAVERGGTHALGVDTRLEDADIGLLAGEFALSGLHIANPTGFAQPDFFSLRSARLALPLGALLEERITIPSLELEGIAIDLERGSRGTNFAQILENLDRLESGGATREKTGASKVFHVQHLALRDIRASVQLMPAGGQLTKLDLDVPGIVVTDLASDMTLAELSGVVVRLVGRAALEAGRGQLPEEFLADLRGRLGKAESSARERLGQELTGLQETLATEAEKLGPEAEQALQKASRELESRLGGLLDGKKKD